MIKIFEYSDDIKDELFIRSDNDSGVSDTVSDVIKRVRTGGDKALRRYTKKFDGVDIEDFLVGQPEISEAFTLVDPRFVDVLRKAAKNITAFHEKQAQEGFDIDNGDGVMLGQKVTPIEKVGLYVPGGTAAYPSSVLMNCIPAKIAKCGEIVMTTPPGKDGKINPNILVAAAIAGVDKVYKLGGAQAVAALAFGTETVLRVDKIVGPGNAYVAEAKRQVFGQVAIEMIAGPSEILVIADDTGSPAHIAADLLSQAEHDVLASAVLVTDSPALAKEVSAELERQIPLLSRAEIARRSIDDRGKIIVVESIAQAIEISNDIAPEHLEICLDNPLPYLDKIKNAGSVFLGKNCPEAVGDYFAGANHTLPTSGTARFSSPLSVDDFVKKTQYIYYTKEALKKVGDDVAYFAASEGLTAHERSVTIRLEDNKDE